MVASAGHWRGVEGATFDTITTAMAALFATPAGPPCPLRAQVFDSADGRLYAAGLTLMVAKAAQDKAEHTRNKSRLTLIDLAKAKTVAAAQVSEPPRFAADLAPGPAADRLAKLIGVRALLPLVAISGESRVFAVRSGGKTAAWLHVIVARIAAPGDQDQAEHTLGVRVIIEPGRGYKAVERLVSDRLGSLPELMFDPEPFHLMLFSTLNRFPGAGFPKGQAVFPADCAAGAAVRLVLGRLLMAWDANEAGVRAETDIEFLHDFRVAGRRARTALGSLKGLLPPDFVALKDDLRWLGLISGPARDLDIYCAHFAAICAAGNGSAGGEAGLEPVRALLEERRAAAHRKLRRALGSARYRELKARWRQALASAPATPAERRPIGAEADRRIAKLFRRVVRDGRALNETSPAAAVHELRKTCKKLRYLLEFFAALYPQKKLHKRIRELKQLQNNLGLFQDLEVQRSMMADLQRELAARGDLLAATHQAMTAIEADLRQRQEQTRQRVIAAFASFATAKNVKAFESMFTGERGK